MSIFGPAWKSTNYDRAHKAVSKISDTALLLQISNESPNSSIRAEAVRKIIDPSILRDIALNHHCEGARVTAVRSRLIDQATLYDVATNSKESLFTARYEACFKIADKDKQSAAAMCIYADVKNSEYVHERQFIVEMLSDQPTLLDIAKNEMDDTTRFKAVERLTDATIDADLNECIAKIIPDKSLLSLACADQPCKPNTHNWTDVGICRKICMNCGKVAYNHNYVTLHDKSWNTDYGFYIAYRCSKCGREGAREENPGGVTNTLQDGWV